MEQLSPEKKKNVKSIIKEIVNLEKKNIFNKQIIADQYDVLKDAYGFTTGSVARLKQAINLEIKGTKDTFEEKTTEVLDLYGEYFESSDES